MEEEACVILNTAVGCITGPALWQLSRELFSGENGVDLELPPRGVDRQPPDFSGEEYGRDDAEMR